MFCWFKKLPINDFQCFFDRVSIEKHFLLIPQSYLLFFLQNYVCKFLAFLNAKKLLLVNSAPFSPGIVFHAGLPGLAVYFNSRAYAASIAAACSRVALQALLCSASRVARHQQACCGVLEAPRWWDFRPRGSAPSFLLQRLWDLGGSMQGQQVGFQAALLDFVVWQGRCHRDTGNPRACSGAR